MITLMIRRVRGRAITRHEDGVQVEEREITRIALVQIGVDDLVHAPQVAGGYEIAIEDIAVQTELVDLGFGHSNSL